MKKVTLSIFILFLLGTTITNAQSTLRKGEKQLNAGLGFSNYGTPIYVGVDFAVHEDITVGPEVSYRRYNQRNGGFKFGLNLLVLAGTANYHFNTLLEIPREFDVYAGVTLGYYIWSVPNDYLGDIGSELGLTAQIGGRYYFDSKWGINLELGGGKASGGKIGISYKF